MTCVTCRHWRGPDIGPDGMRECRPGPPPFAHEEQLLGEPRKPRFVAAWPLTRPGDGCGAHEAAPAEPAQAPVSPIAPKVTPAARKKG